LELEDKRPMNEFWDWNLIVAKRINEFGYEYSRQRCWVFEAKRMIC